MSNRSIVEPSKRMMLSPGTGYRSPGKNLKTPIIGRVIEIQVLVTGDWQLVTVFVEKEIYEFCKRLPRGISQLTIFTSPAKALAEAGQSLSDLSHLSQPSRFRHSSINFQKHP